ncbi:MAG: hypothetical protein Q8Q09_21785 [Deltaproteobacteria bacterium]|nr:hypothetical protein [Deltaproteobacteria bacterium]
MNIDLAIPVFSDGDQLAFLTSLAESLRSKGLQIAFLSTTEIATTSLRSRGFEVVDLYEGLDRSVRPSIECMRGVELRYGIHSLRSFVYPELTYDWAHGIDELLTCAVHVLARIDRFASENTVRAYFNYVGAEVVRRSVEVIARLHGAHTIVGDVASFPQRFLFAKSEIGVQIPPIADDITAEEIAHAESIVDQMLHHRKPFAPVSHLGFGLSNFRGAARLFRVLHRMPDVNASRLVAERVLRVARRVVGTALYQDVKLDEPFVFFPLHLANDSVITVRAPQFQRQEDLVAFVSERALPSGYKLYVKPHIGARDAYSVEMMTKISRMPNVRLVKPTINPHDMIDRAAVNLVINSTTGFEGILHRKPVVVLGNPYYRGHGLTVDVDGLRELPAAIERAITFVPDRELMLRFIAHYWRMTYEGVYGDLAEDNISRFAAALEHRLEMLS